MSIPAYDARGRGSIARRGDEYTVFGSGFYLKTPLKLAEKWPGNDTVTEFLGSIVVSIPACHAGDRGSIPRRGEEWSFLLQDFIQNHIWWKTVHKEI